MIENNALADKSVSFATRIVRCFQYLQDEKKEFIISKQVLRSGTSIGANIHEAIYGQSTADFISKLSIALKEASETSYWIVVLKNGGYLEESVYTSLKKDVDEIIRMLISSIKTTRKNEKYAN